MGLEIAKSSYFHGYILFARFSVAGVIWGMFRVVWCIYIATSINYIANVSLIRIHAGHSGEGRRGEEMKWHEDGVRTLSLR